jgi:histidine triad (HIT) family protein
MDNCIFCKIVNKEIPSKIRYEDENFLAIDDIYPKAKVHILLITKKHFLSLDEIDDSALLEEILPVAKKIAHKNGLVTGYRIVINTKEDGGQEVEHFHLHILGGSKLSSKM